MKIPPVITLDFETLPIQKRPDYPPKPVSMSIQMPHWDRPKFFAWGHLTGRNSCTWNDAKRIIHAVRDSGLPVLCHHAHFDVDVAETHMEVEPWPWHQVHDSMYSLFILDPFARSLGLKEQAEKRLNMPPDERDSVKEWLLAHKAQLEADFPEIVEVHGGIRPSSASAFIAYAPPEIVGPYADGDVVRTLALFKKTWRDLDKGKMLEAYDRERRLSPWLILNERQGVRVDLLRLQDLDRKMETEAFPAVDAYLRKRLKSDTINLDSGDEVVEALKHSGLGKGFASTPTGKDSRSLESIEGAVKDKDLKLALQYRTRLANQHRNFIKGWTGQATKTGGLLMTSWNQVKNGDDASVGARTGRLSTAKPFNLLAITKGLGRRGKKAVHPTFLGSKALQLPHLRTLLLPDVGDVWVRRDFVGQELKMLSHFEGGELQLAHQNPEYDIHKYVMGAIREITGIQLDRDQSKVLNFGLIYGMGLTKLAASLGVSEDEARRIKFAQMKALPGVDEMQKDLKQRYRDGESVRTWGGRALFAEPPRVIKGQLKHFDFRMINHLVQGSSAEVSKEAVIRFHEAGLRSRFLGLVHDELNASTPAAYVEEECLAIRDVMLSVETDVPLLSGCEVGPSWGEVKEVAEDLPDLSRWTQ